MNRRTVLRGISAGALGMIPGANPHIPDDYSKRLKDLYSEPHRTPWAGVIQYVTEADSTRPVEVTASRFLPDGRLERTVLESDYRSPVYASDWEWVGMAAAYVWDPDTETDEITGAWGVYASPVTDSWTAVRMEWA